MHYQLIVRVGLLALLFMSYAYGMHISFYGTNISYVSIIECTKQELITQIPSILLRYINQTSVLVSLFLPYILAQWYVFIRTFKKKKTNEITIFSLIILLSLLVNYSITKYIDNYFNQLTLIEQTYYQIQLIVIPTTILALLLFSFRKQDQYKAIPLLMYIVVFLFFAQKEQFRQINYDLESLIILSSLMLTTLILFYHQQALFYIINPQLEKIIFVKNQLFLVFGIILITLFKEHIPLLLQLLGLTTTIYLTTKRVINNTSWNNYFYTKWVLETILLYNILLLLLHQLSIHNHININLLMVIIILRFFEISIKWVINYERK